MITEFRYIHQNVVSALRVCVVKVQIIEPFQEQIALVGVKIDKLTPEQEQYLSSWQL